MATSQNKKNVYLPTEIAQLVKEYQRAHDLTEANALLELVISGLLQEGVSPFSHLKPAFDKLQSEWASSYDPVEAQDGDYTFKRFVMKHYAPQWGGKRK